MPTITIDGTACEFEKGQMILQVAKANGIEIPHYCYHEGLSIVASCRICLVEVWAPNPRNDYKLEAIPKLLPACQTPAGEGQVVYLDSPKVLANQKQVMEYLLINHPLDCPVCDQAGECYLQDYSYRYGRSVSRFEDDKIKQPKKDLGPTVYLYSDRCIMCSRCVRFTREISGTSELCVVGRGATEQIDLFPGKALDNEMSGNVVDVCPVGAMLDKDFLFSQRVWFMTSTPSIDGLTAGGDNIHIEHNKGTVYRIKPRTNPDVNKWWISDEVRYGYKHIHSDDRLTSPHRAQHGERINTTWPSILEEVDSVITRMVGNGATVAALISPMLTCEEAFLIADYAKGWHVNRGQAIIGIGPVPVDGEDRTYPPTAKPGDANAYTVRAEKAPNARGVKRVLAAMAGDGKGDLSEPMDFDAWLEAVKAADIVIITGNYPNDWVPKELTRAVTKKFVVHVDTLTNGLSVKADVVLPSSTWAEKSGTFENVDGLLQVFEQAIEPIDGAAPEGRIFTHLITLAEGKPLTDAPHYDAGLIRQRLAEEVGLTEFVDTISIPVQIQKAEPDVAIVDL
ncbi:MAG: hypothetical protein D8M59_01365 [Planctomycetes bacterium]|nr:hypothetical protein [Planctomycetota bacterium]NOG54630.1 molybdopterin-dependent oxidoreductase [Planctomycetota bacterium]